MNNGSVLEALHSTRGKGPTAWTHSHPRATAAGVSTSSYPMMLLMLTCLPTCVSARVTRYGEAACTTGKHECAAKLRMGRPSAGADRPMGLHHHRPTVLRLVTTTGNYTPNLPPLLVQLMLNPTRA